MKQRDYVIGMRRQVGWFVILGIGAVLLVLLVISVRTDVFAKKFSLYLSPPSATAFFTGQPVKFQGFTIGRIGDIELLEQGKVRITLRLLERYRHMLHVGSKGRLIKEGLIGEQVVEVTAGDKEKSVLRDKATIAYEKEDTVQELMRKATPIVADAKRLLNQMADFAAWLNDPKGDFRRTIAHISTVTQDLKEADVKGAVILFTEALQQLKEMAGQAVKFKLAKQLAESLKLTTEILSDIEPLAHSLGKTGPQTLARVNLLLKRVDQLTASLNVIAEDLAELTPELPGLARESRGTIEEMHGLLKGLRGSWLFGGGSEAPEEEDEGIAPPALDLRP